MEWYIKAIKEFSNFSGRARRTEYWSFVLVSTIISIIMTVIDFALLTKGLKYGIGYFSAGYSLLILIPTISLFIRRLHDIDKSGYSSFISLIPIVGGIWILLLTITPGTVGDNNYGSDPKSLY